MNRPPTHSLLRRQLKKLLAPGQEIPASWLPLLEMVDESYRQFDADRQMMERSLDLSSRELLDAHMQTRAIFNLLPDLFFRVDENGTILDCRTGDPSLLFMPRDKVIGRRLHAIPVPEVRAVFRHAMEEVLARQQSVTVDYKLETLGGERYFEAILIPLKGRQVIIFIRDISLRRQVDAELRRLAKAVEQSDESVVISDPDGTIRYVNPAFERITGFLRTEVVGTNPRHAAPGAGGGMWDNILRGENWHGRYTERRKDGALYEAEATVSLIRDDSGKPQGFVSVSRDVTREAHLEDQLRQSQKMEAVGRLAGGIAHDFNNLLTAIIGNTELAMNRSDLPERARRDLGEISKASNRAASLVSQLLAFGRKQVLHPRVISINSAVSEVTRLLQRTIRENIELRVELDPGSWPIRVDPLQLEQVVMNLILNARDALPDGGRLTVRTHNLPGGGGRPELPLTLPPGDYVCLEVSDTGVGMDDYTRAHIFEPFFTTKEVGRGTGLGLATVYGIVKQSGGTIGFETREGRGTTFCVCFPRVEGAVAEPGEARPPGQPARGTETILLVEDEALVRNLVRKMLEQYGYRVLEAALPADALAQVRNGKDEVDLLLTDVVMPGMSGEALMRQVVEVRPGLKVLFMSGHPESMVTHMGVLTTGDSFIKKPFTGEALARKIREVLDAR